MIYKQPSIYKSGDDLEKQFNDNFIEIRAKVLDKYKNYVDYENFQLPIIYNKLTQVFLFNRALNVTQSFTPYYSSDDIKGDVDWPTFAYFEIPSSHRETLYFPLRKSVESPLRTWALASYEDNIVAIRMDHNDGALPIGYNFLMSGAMQIKK
jgi:hypothetical protein